MPPPARPSFIIPHLLGSEEAGAADESAWLASLSPRSHLQDVSPPRNVFLPPSPASSTQIPPALPRPRAEVTMGRLPGDRANVPKGTGSCLFRFSVARVAVCVVYSKYARNDLHVARLCIVLPLITSHQTTIRPFLLLVVIIYLFGLLSK